MTERGNWPDEEKHPFRRSKKLRVLLVDDDSLTASLFSKVIGKLDCACATASNGEEALRKLSGHEKFDLVMSDCEMPVVGGAELVRRIRAGALRTSAIPIVCTSSRRQIGAPLPKECMGCAVDAIMGKPVTAAEAKRVIARLRDGCFQKVQEAVN